MEPYSVPWLKVVAASLAVTVEQAVCVMTDGETLSPMAGEGTMVVAEATSGPERHCARESRDTCWGTGDTID